MLVLRNIKMKDNIISADYYPENEEVFGHIEVDVKSDEIIFLKKAPGYEHSTDPIHAQYALMGIAKSGKIPKERTVLWY